MLPKVACTTSPVIPSIRSPARLVFSHDVALHQIFETFVMFILSELQEDVVRPVLIFVMCELIGVEPGADGEGVLGPWGGVEQLCPRVGNMVCQIQTSAQHSDGKTRTASLDPK